MKGDNGKKPKRGVSLTGRTFAKCPRVTLLAIFRPKTSRSPSDVTPRGHIYRLVFDLTALSSAVFDPERVAQNERIHHLQCTVLPVRGLFKTCISDAADKVCGQHRVGKSLSLSNKRSLKRALGAARKRGRIKSVRSSAIVCRAVEVNGDRRALRISRVRDDLNREGLGIRVDVFASATRDHKPYPRSFTRRHSTSVIRRPTQPSL